jgi:hypothetical protein
VTTKVCDDFWSVDLILFFIKIILVVCGLNRTISAVNSFFIVYEIWLFLSSL